ncbi:MAG: MFS transporter [Candidatus Hermodarchaeota archaeon]
MNDETIEFKKYYIPIFATNYLFQGVVTSMFAVIVPIYLITLIGGVTASEIAFLASIILLPFSIKLVYGIMTDKYGSKRFGRRRPYILSSSILAGFTWIIIPLLVTPVNALLLFAITGLIIFFGIALSDTALDGLILDICPKPQLARTQGFCWAGRSIGVITGGPILAYLHVVLGFITIEVIFTMIGIIMIICSFFMILVKEIKNLPEVYLKKHIKNMFNKSREWKLYIYAIFNSLMDGAVTLFLSIFIMIQLNLISLEGTSLSLDRTAKDIYLYQANISLLISLGVIIGAIIGGQVTDKISRRLGVYSAMMFGTIALLLVVLPVSLIGTGLLLFFAAFVGFSMGYRMPAFSAVIGEISKEHPEMDSTFFAVCNSFNNLGGPIGLALTGIIFNFSASFVIVFIFMALIMNIALIFFRMLNPQDYEYKLSEKYQETKAIK